jgi:hypothetical protein
MYLTVKQTLFTSKKGYERYIEKKHKKFTLLEYEALSFNVFNGSSSLFNTLQIGVNAL